MLCIIFGCAPSPTSQTPSAPTPCPEANLPVSDDAIPTYTPSLSSDFVMLRDGQFTARNTSFLVRGVNYYPSRFPWRRFLTETDLDTVRNEFLLLRAAGFNTLRIFLWNAALFSCDSKETRPNTHTFERLDVIIQAAANQGFHLIVTLNDMPPDGLYSNPAYVQDQTRFIVGRYKDESAILAWDLRNEGDIDYGSNDSFGRGKVAKTDVLDWLRQTAELVRGIDSHHLLTAGWLHDSEATAPYVDFLSFHHWDDAGQLRDHIDGLKGMNKPILLEEFGYSTFRVSPDEQSRLIAEAIQTADSENTLGWLAWTAFDFSLDATCIPPACPSQDNAEHHFGLWFRDYTPKPVVQMLLNR